MSEKGKKWDGRSRIPTENYKKRYDEIFKKKTQELETEKEVLERMKYIFKGKNNT
tara:strand:+ start:79 stop:243 length:165 start_codon:yes stop_codon:yes gene_type:complete